jgi:maltooligosyltrehalose trehalohydrolase
MEPLATRRCGARAAPDGTVHWRVWAPRARQVELVLVDGDRRCVRPMAPEEKGYFRYAEAGVPDGQRYCYRLDGGPELPDPASLWQPDGVHAPSAVYRPERFAVSNAPWSGVRRQDLVFYELHVGTFTPDGTFDAAIPRLDSLRDLGVTAIEIMPVGQFPGPRNWGYDGVFPYAAQNSYGGPEALQRLVDACHRCGLAAFLDVVYNHLGPEGNYLSRFGPYFTDRYRTAWGPAFNYDDCGCDAVRDFVLDNARMWLDEYRFDGLRLDAVHAIFDASPRSILRALKEAADAVAARRGYAAHLIAESDLNDVRPLLPPEQGGSGLDTQWSDDFHHVVHAFLTGERQGYYEDFDSPRQLRKALEDTFVYDGAYSRHRGRRHGAPALGLPGDRFVISIQNHDQVGNRARGDRLASLVSPEKQRLAACLLLLAPHLPLLFMGEEYGEKNPFLFFSSFPDPELARNVREGRRREFAAFAWQGEVPDPQAESTFEASRLSWSWPDGTFHAGLRRLYHDLLVARRAWPALRDFSRRAARLLPDDEHSAVLELIRGGREPGPGETLQVYFNLTSQPQPVPQNSGLTDRFLFSSEARIYAGGRPETDPASTLLPFECLAFGPVDWERIA